MAVTPGRPDVVRAAGGVVWRMADGDLQVVVVHRPGPGYDDWTFPKGKREATDVDDEHCALREVEEETGYRCALGRELVGTTYFDRKRRPKMVRYWEMTVVSGSFSPNPEVDELRWLPVNAVRSLLSFPRDRDVLDAFERFARTS